MMDRKLGKTTDSLLLLSLMILSGMGLLTLYGQMMPLSDIFNAHKMIDVLSFSHNNFSGGIVIGCAMLLLLSCVNYLKLFQQYRSRWTKYMGFGKNTLVSVAPGLPFVIVAILLMLMLRLFGTAPEGSDARVNLFGFQPSEIVKYLIVVFMAFFFYAKGDVIKTFGTRLTTLARRRYVFIISVVLIVIAVVCMLFLAMLKDMGPGIVILATFILLYSMARRDMFQLFSGIISYIVLVGCVYMVTDTVTIRLMAVVAWFVIWIAYGWFGKKTKTVYESAIFFNVLVSLFLVGGYVFRPFLPHMADRLFNRTNMAWSGIFDNASPQGDQIAQGLWG
ncbi:MAG: FtsW/RodA/SpoVE family cell cycle protein, partial [Muribaculaceae bacterium]|nr:FtsW/RodA/SpoVE family cell cycle protein [Muribaculaceae bacterium]